jgi:hypothetical protein
MERPEADGLESMLYELSRILWRQRALIEVLQYRLEVQQFVSDGDRADRLAFALEEVDSALDDIRRSERLRGAVVRRCSLHLGLGEDANLSEIRSRVPEPWQLVLAEHQAALLSLVNGAERQAGRNRELAQRGIAETKALFAALTGERPATTYGPSPRAVATTASPQLLDWEA